MNSTVRRWVPSTRLIAKDYSNWIVLSPRQTRTVAALRIDDHVEQHFRDNLLIEKLGVANIRATVQALGQTA